MKNKYYALVGRIPGNENSLWASPRPTTEGQALSDFADWLHIGDGDADTREQLVQTEGVHTYVDAVFVSDTLITLASKPITTLV